MVVVGGGIVGLATALAVTEREPGASVAVLEKEAAWASHQTGHNSGVLHSGIYYAPGSLKARLCQEGNAALRSFCRAEGVAYEVCGKLIVATSAPELAGLAALERRAGEHGLAVERLGPAGITDREPHAQGLGALHLASTGIVDFRLVAEAMARVLTARGTSLQRSTRVTGWRESARSTVVETDQGPVTGRFVVNCAGLHADRVARLSGVDPGASIVPFRGEYHELRPERSHLVRGLLYPVPDPTLPFLGVHLTRGIDGIVHAGPNAVLALDREGYRRRDVDVGDLAELATSPALWRLARRHLRTGIDEVLRSLSRERFARSLQRLVPEIEAGDLLPAPAGVRAQALRPNGELVDDFLIVEGPRSLHVGNAPSPAATSSLAIGRHLARRMPSLAELRS